MYTVAWKEQNHAQYAHHGLGMSLREVTDAFLQGGPKVGLQLFHYFVSLFRSNLFLGCSKEQGL